MDEKERNEAGRVPAEGGGAWRVTIVQARPGKEPSTMEREGRTLGSWGSWVLGLQKLSDGDPPNLTPLPGPLSREDAIAASGEHRRHAPVPFRRPSTFSHLLIPASATDLT